MGKKKEYKEANRRFLKKLSFQEGVCALPCGIYYKVLETGESTISPGARSIVTVHYKGSLIDDLTSVKFCKLLHQVESDSASTGRLHFRAVHLIETLEDPKNST